VRVLRATLVLSVSACAIAGLTGCATPVVRVSKNYYAQPVKTAAYVGFNDAASVENSGSQVEGVFARYLTNTSYTLIGLDEAQQTLSNKGQTLGNLQDPSDNVRLGKVLGVDAVISGWISQYTDTSESTVIVDEPQTETETHFHTGPDRAPSMVTNTITTDNYVPETETLPARVGIGVHMVNVKTGEVLWSASYTGDGSILSAATEKAASQLTQALQDDLNDHKVTP
jgi:hypothetical protein